ncbi:hypothetical protein Ahy_A09g045026 isoform B [Arachis hypogaea]|uniref:Uncharacterized protein n=1 Tax=Arachis hypogaea TaxID=3818 RepID=A0A444XJA4_ARAHY|nr:hypothetical protein Ahy_B09g096228 isoform B [Arachis hypogaea]RYR39474.1 hypothetical protein Ahy_A09g045026 isoform B [Arachis hypogaea]
MPTTTTTGPTRPHRGPRCGPVTRTEAGGE